MSASTSGATISTPRCKISTSTVSSIQSASSGLLAVLGSASASIRLTFSQMLQIRWRRWLTRRYLGVWLDGTAYYRLQLEGDHTDNPDQRISDDLNRFTDASLTLALGLLSSRRDAVLLPRHFVVVVGSDNASAWQLRLGRGAGLHGVVRAPLRRTRHLVTFKVGRPLVALNFPATRYEADFRFSLVRLRENAEIVALLWRRDARDGDLPRPLRPCVDNFWSIMRRTRRSIGGPAFATTNSR